MAAKLLKGAEVAKEIREKLKKEVDELKAKHNVVPGLVTILVGEDPASESYVRAPIWMRRRCWLSSTSTTRIQKFTASWCSFPCPNTSTIRRSCSPSIRTRTWMVSTPPTWENC